MRNGEAEQQKDEGNLMGSALSRIKHPGDRYPMQQQGKNLRMEIR